MNPVSVIKGLAVAFAVATAAVCGAQDYPNRAIRMVVPFVAGSNADVNARLVTAHMSKQMGQGFVIENRGGASGIIGIEAAAKAEPNGYTVLFTTVSIAINPTVFKKLPYDTVNDFVPVTNVANGIGMLLVVNPASGMDSVKELLTRASLAPKKISFGSSGIGSATAIAAHLLEGLARVDMLHVPFKGVPPAVTALMGGEINVVITPPNNVLSQVKSGKLKAIAYTGGTRWAEMPGVPTMIESGVPGYRYDNFWHGMFAPRGTPAPMVSRLAGEVRRALQVTEVKAGLIAAGFDPVGDSPEEFRKYFGEELERWREIARITKLVPE